MARLPRFAVPGQPQHVIQRGNNREVIFVSDDDYRFYLEALQEACVKYQCDVHAYILMTNHVHLLRNQWGQTRLIDWFLLFLPQSHNQNRDKSWHDCPVLLSPVNLSMLSSVATTVKLSLLVMTITDFT